MEAAVADYFEMFEKELRGEDYNKSEHRRRLARLLPGRSNASIERKHQNTSACLIELGFPYIPGYKPLKNFQSILLKAVESRLSAAASLIELVRVQAEAPADVPPEGDLLEIIVDPPEAKRPARLPDGRDFVRDRKRLRCGVDYLEIEARNRLLGRAGEELILRFERLRLEREGCEALARKVEWISTTQGDGEGYDVLSFERSGRERFIEVKTTASGSRTPFFVTRREVEASRHFGTRFHLYRLFEFRTRPRFFDKPGPVDEGFAIEPTTYLAKNH